MNIEAAMVATDGLIAATSLHAHAAAIVATSTGLRPMASEREPMIGEMTISMPAEIEPMLAKSAVAAAGPSRAISAILNTMSAKTRQTQLRAFWRPAMAGCPKPAMAP